MLPSRKYRSTSTPEMLSGLPGSSMILLSSLSVTFARGLKDDSTSQRSIASSVYRWKNAPYVARWITRVRRSHMRPGRWTAITEPAFAVGALDFLRENLPDHERGAARCGPAFGRRVMESLRRRGTMALP